MAVGVERFALGLSRKQDWLHGPVMCSCTWSPFSEDLVLYRPVHAILFWAWNEQRGYTGKCLWSQWHCSGSWVYTVCRPIGLATRHEHMGLWAVQGASGLSRWLGRNWRPDWQWGQKQQQHKQQLNPGKKRDPNCLKTWEDCQFPRRVSPAAPAQLFSGAQAIDYVSKLLQSKSELMHVAIKHVRELLELVKEFRVSSSKNYCNTAIQISTVLQIEIKPTQCSCSDRKNSIIIWNFR